MLLRTRAITRRSKIQVKSRQVFPDHQHHFQQQIEDRIVGPVPLSEQKNMGQRPKASTLSVIEEFTNPHSSTISCCLHEYDFVTVQIVSDFSFPRRTRHLRQETSDRIPTLAVGISSYAGSSFHRGRTSLSLTQRTHAPSTQAKRAVYTGVNSSNATHRGESITPLKKSARRIRTGKQCGEALYGTRRTGEGFEVLHVYMKYLGAIVDRGWGRKEVADGLRRAVS